MQQTSPRTPFRIIALAVLFAVLVSASTASAQEKTFLKERYVFGPIRVFYITEGKDAVPLDDVDHTGVPDRVEDIAKQVWAAHHLFCEALKFPDPFKSERYKGVTCIQVSLRDLGGGNGLAFDEPQRARRIPEGKPTDRAIVMSINCKLNPMKNITPAHETFHLVQYGATYFKNPWFLEGMARWSEHALAREALGHVKYSPRGPWPQRPQDLQQLSTMKYDAEHVLWNPIVRRTGRDDLLSNRLLGEKLAALRYSDRTPVLRDRTLQGAEIMRDIVIELGRLDDVAFEELEYDSWSEENQRAEENGPYIYKAVMDVFRRRVPSVGPYEVPAVKRPAAQNKTADGAFRVGSVWTGESEFADFKLTVLKRSGGRFKARFESTGWRREVSGTASGSSISWKAKDVRVVEGSTGGDNQGTIVTDDRGTRIDFAWRGSKGQGTFTLRKQD